MKKKKALSKTRLHPYHTTHSERAFFDAVKKFLFMCWPHSSWCEFMWWITNQILKAGVKKSHTYDEQNEKKVFQGVEFITKISLEYFHHLL